MWLKMKGVGTCLNATSDIIAVCLEKNHGGLQRRRWRAQQEIFAHNL
jgi:hypothetical protein